MPVDKYRSHILLGTEPGLKSLTTDKYPSLDLLNNSCMTKSNEQSMCETKAFTAHIYIRDFLAGTV